MRRTPPRPFALHGLAKRCTQALTALLLSSLTVAAIAKPLPKLAKPLDESRKVTLIVVLLEQSEVAVDDVDVNGGAAGGLIGALIEIGVESKMSKNRQETIAPVRDVLLDLRFEDLFLAALKRHVPASAVAPDAGYVIARSEIEWRELLRENVGRMVMLVNTRYAFEQNFDIAYVNSMMSIQPVRTRLPDEAKWEDLSNRKRKLYFAEPLHVGNYYSSHAMYPMYGKREKVDGEAGFETNAARWSQDAGRATRQAFADAADEVATLIRREIERELPAPGPKTRAMVPSRYFAPLSRKLPRIDNAAGRLLLQDKYEMHWVDADQVKP